MVTDSKWFLYLNDIEGLSVGHVPWGLSGAFLRLIEKGCSIFTHATDMVTDSKWFLYLNDIEGRHVDHVPRGLPQANRERM